MKTRIRDILSSQNQSRHSNRSAELTRIATCLQDGGPIVVWLHGPMGSGKTELLSAFAKKAKDDGATIFGIDCRTVEPTISGLLDALGELLRISLKDLDDAATTLSGSGVPTVIMFDNYEVFRLADSWLRREFIPALSASARIVLVSREPPAAGWISSTEWRDYFLTVSLEAHDELSAEELTRRYRAEVPEPEIRQAIDAVSVVRRITRPMLASLCPQIPDVELFEKLAGLSFVETRRDGLAIQDSLRKVIGSRLQAADVKQYRHYQQEAWKLLRQQLRESAHADLWRCTADIIYLIENPVIREAFFPSQSAHFSVEPAMPENKQAVMDTIERHEPPGAIKALELWWQYLPSAFHVIKDATGTIAGFYCMAKPDELGDSWLQSDPIARNWQHHLNLRGRSARAPSLFLRRWLSRDDGESPSAVQAAAWVDIKRTYLELRPQLRRVYLTLRDIGPYGPAATELGFTVLEDCTVSLTGASYHTAMLDFGPGSVDGWICRLLAAELGIAEGQLLDTASRELVLNGSRIPLTPLEFSLVSMLESRAGAAVSRSDLLQQVWGHDYEGGSNVVDAVVRGLRKKCGDNARVLETVRGVGYRLRI
ncbi:MAG: winged helix-turn-helix domain-containing protein [Gammaproteobacteria bacterium]|nr:winged helix-turn-helix domain-containing protein [Gammaproteobacteria bacterium]